MSIDDVLYPLIKNYLASPQWVKNSFGEYYSQIPASLRLGSTYRRYRRELNVIERSRIGEFSAQKLRETILWTVSSVPAFQAMRSKIGTCSNPHQALLEFPCMSKMDVKRDPDRYISSLTSASSRLKMFTGGSTLEPMQFFVERGKARPKEHAFMENFNLRLSKSKRALTLSLRGRTVPAASEGNQRLWMYEPIKHHLILSSDHLEPKYMEEYVLALKKWQPHYVEAFPSALYPLARWFAENPHNEITAHIHGIALVSENVYAYQMELFRKVFNCPILKHFGHSERVVMAASMPDDDRYFFWPQYGKLELLDQQGNPITKPGEIGEIVGTSFDNRVMPFIRYRTGDLAVWSEREHPLLPGYPVCERIEGRLQEFVVCKDHRLVSITTLGAAHFEELAEAERIQYEQHHAGYLILNVQVTKPLSETIRKRVSRAVVEKTQNGCEVDVREVEQILRSPRGKHKMLIQHLDISNHLGAAAIE